MYMYKVTVMYILCIFSSYLWYTQGFIALQKGLYFRVSFQGVGIIFHTLYIQNEVLKCCLNEVILSKPNCIIQLNTWIHSQSLSML